MRRFATRRRLVAAFTLLGAAFAAAFAFQLAGLARMKGALQELHEHEDQMRLALELEAAIREQFAHQAHLVVGEERHLPRFRKAQERASALAAELAASVEEPEASAWAHEIADVTGELDRIFRERIAPAVRASDGDAARAHAAAYPLVFRAEQAADRIFAFLRERTAGRSGVVERMHGITARLAILFAVAVPLLAVGLALHLSRSIARPLAVIGDGAARIARGDLGTRIAVRGVDEFGALAQELNAMAEALARDREELLRAERLAGLGRVAAGIAHELNDPLQVMIGYLGLHRDRVGGELGRHLQRVEREATRCKEIVEGLLELARPAAFVPVTVDLRAVADEVAETLRAAAAGGPRIEVRGEGTALGTEGRLRQIASNLARNAVQAAGPGGTVRLEVGCAGGSAWLSVSDTGPGVPSEVRQRIFEPFYTTRASGTGLGLAIGRAIADGMGGELVLADGGAPGARFTLRVPAPQDGGGG